MKQFGFALLCSTFLCGQCNKSRQNDCDGQQICTAMFATVGVHISQNGTPYQLDRYITKRHSDSLVIDIHSRLSNFEDSLYRAQGNYPIITDSEMNLLRRQGTGFTFIGYRNNQEVLRENYVLGHDCCHVQKVSGRSEVNF